MISWRERPFEPGEEIEYCGIVGVVLQNFGRSGIVDVDGDRIDWDWRVFGADCVRTGRVFEVK